MMKKIFLLLSLGLSGFFATGQKVKDTVVIHHKYYTSVYVISKHIPALVEYELMDTMLICDTHLDRGRFAKDPDYPGDTDLDKDYKGTKYDRGHNMSSKNNDCYPIAMKECFYFSNMFPQTHKLNAGSWFQLEKAERDLAKQHKRIKVFIGNLGELKTIGNTHEITVPKFCWKAIYFPDTKEYSCYIFPNDESEQKAIGSYKVTLSELETKSRMKFQAEHVKIGTINQY